MIQLAILLTSHNRKTKTLSCLKSIRNQEGIDKISSEIYLVDDNSSDGTYEAISSEFPHVNIIKGDGNLFWAGGMRLAWRSAIKTGKQYDYFLLLNDDTLLFSDALKNLFADISTIQKEKSILIGSTQNEHTGEFSYGGRLLKNNYNSSWKIIKPNGLSPQLCHLGNANIMLVPNETVNAIGILSDDYTHSIADYDYTMKARKAGISTFICSHYCGYCADDHGVNWKSSEHSLRERIQYLYSHKGLSYNEYLIYIRRFFPLYLPQAWFLLWAKTFFPIFWESRRKKSDRKYLIKGSLNYK
ncbi:MAG: glycosyltransferase family 2 protein [Chitinophagaceae bacterium]